MKNNPYSLSVIMPVYNEETTLLKIVESVLAVPEVTELIAVDDNSKDKSVSILKKVKSKKVKLIQHKKNKGKGAAIQSGLALARSNYVLIQDADLEYDPREIPTLLQPIKEEKARVIYGSRFLGPHTQMFYWHFLGNRFLNWVVNILFNSTLTDMETCYKLLPKELMKELKLKENDFRIEPEITCKLLKLGEKIYEVPISYAGRTYDGFWALLTIFKVRLS
jgi:glycosyltransferase involved in cell wall biosynthesis